MGDKFRDLIPAHFVKRVVFRGIMGSTTMYLYHLSDGGGDLGCDHVLVSYARGINETAVFPASPDGQALSRRELTAVNGCRRPDALARLGYSMAGPTLSDLISTKDGTK